MSHPRSDFGTLKLIIKLISTRKHAWLWVASGCGSCLGCVRVYIQIPLHPILSSAGRDDHIAADDMTMRFDALLFARYRAPARSPRDAGYLQFAPPSTVLWPASGQSGSPVSPAAVSSRSVSRFRLASLFSVISRDAVDFQ